MRYLNIETSTIDSEAYQEATRAQQAVWMALLRYCVGQLNGGLILACLNWADTKWQRVVRVSSREVNCESPLWHFEGSDLRVSFYPTGQEENYRKICAGAKAGGNTLWEKRRNASGAAPGKSPGNAQWNGTEYKEKEGNVPLLPSSSGPADLGAMRTEGT